MKPLSRVASTVAPLPSLLHDIGTPGEHLHRGPGHERMAGCLGVWKVHGVLANSATRMVCTESYEWVPGHYFILYRFDRQIGANKHQGTGVIGYDPERRSHSAYFVDNMGFARTYDVHIDNNKWTLTGSTERATLNFDPVENRMRARWEHSADGKDWSLLCDFEGKREDVATGAKANANKQTTLKNG